MADPPSGFNPVVATDRELTRYGFPPRPHRESNSELYQKWRKTFGGSLQLFAPQFTQPSSPWPRSQRLSIVEGNNSGNWSGVLCVPPAGDSFNLMITGVFGVPHLTSVGSIGIWIGIGGNSSTVSLLQAGVTGQVDSSGEESFGAFYEWQSPNNPVGPVPLGDFPISAGDSIEVQIWVTSTATATLVMQNLTSNAPAIIKPISAATGVSVSGVSAEWIVERPLIGFDSQHNPIFATLPDYSPVVFTDAVAWVAPQSSTGMMSLSNFARNHGCARPVSIRSIAKSLNLLLPASLRAILSEVATVFAGSGTVFTMTQNGTTLSTAEIVNNTTVQCQYGAAKS
jgi:hypothetical protein